MVSTRAVYTWPRRFSEGAKLHSTLRMEIRGTSNRRDHSEDVVTSEMNTTREKIITHNKTRTCDYQALAINIKINVAQSFYRYRRGR